MTQEGADLSTFLAQHQDSSKTSVECRERSSVKPFKLPRFTTTDTLATAAVITCPVPSFLKLCTRCLEYFVQMSGNGELHAEDANKCLGLWDGWGGMGSTEVCVRSGAQAIYAPRRAPM